MIFAMPASTDSLEATEIDDVLGGIARDLRDLRRVAPGRLAHSGVNGVPGVGERAGSERTEAARGATDDNNCFMT